jgi:hypothetical protein
MEIKVQNTTKTEGTALDEADSSSSGIYSVNGHAKSKGKNNGVKEGVQLKGRDLP